MPADVLRLFVFARHAESAANAANVLNSDPSQPVALTVRGLASARVSRRHLSV
jgi:broad specificity phosphatase PhoE